MDLLAPRTRAGGKGGRNCNKHRPTFIYLLDQVAVIATNIVQHSFTCWTKLPCNTAGVSRLLHVLWKEEEELLERPLSVAVLVRLRTFLVEDLSRGPNRDRAVEPQRRPEL